MPPGCNRDTHTTPTPHPHHTHLNLLHGVSAVTAGHVVVEPRPALVLTGTLGALEVGGLPRAAEVVVLHPAHAAALELTPLRITRLTQLDTADTKGHS